MYHRLLILCLLVSVPLAGCAATPSPAQTRVAVCEDDEDNPQDSCWWPFAGPDGQYGALMCACYALVLAAAAAGVWALAASDGWRERLP